MTTESRNRWAAIGALAILSTMTIVGEAASDVEQDDHMFVGAQKCATCHKKTLIGNQFAVWKGGPHARAFETLASDKAFEYAEAAGIDEPQEAAECLTCHVTGFGLPAKRLARRKPIVEEGVGCESCHGAGKDYRNEKTMSDLDLARSLGLRLPTDADCRSCHNEKSPAWDPERYALPDGSRVGFDYEQAWKRIEHSIPSDVKGRYLELKKD